MEFNCVQDCSQCCIEREYYPEKKFGKIGVLILPEEKERIQRELEEKQEAELKAKEEEEARIQAELNKGDKDKVKDLIGDLLKLKSKYSFKSQKNKKMYTIVNSKLDDIVELIGKGKMQ